MGGGGRRRRRKEGRKEEEDNLAPQTKFLDSPLGRAADVVTYMA
jgi:hypothetical protein